MCAHQASHIAMLRPSLLRPALQLCLAENCHLVDNVLAALAGLTALRELDVSSWTVRGLAAASAPLPLLLLLLLSRLLLSRLLLLLLGTRVAAWPQRVPLRGDLTLHCPADLTLHCPAAPAGRSSERRRRRPPGLAAPADEPEPGRALQHHSSGPRLPVRLHSPAFPVRDAAAPRGLPACLSACLSACLPVHMI